MVHRRWPLSLEWLLLGALFMLGGLARAQDDPPGRVGRIAAVQGEAQVFDADEGRWVAAVPNRPFTDQDRIATGADGRVELQIGSTTLRLAGGTEVEATRLDDEGMQFALLRGSVALRLRAAQIAAETEIVTPEGRFTPLRAGLYRVDRRDQTSTGSVWRGELGSSARDLRLTLQPGERAEVWFDAVSGAARSDRVPPLDDEFAAAVLRDEAADTGVAPVFVSPEMTGAEDLDRYGRWQQNADYGALWIPYQVPAGWAPYRYGHWVWLQPWGWTWVDDAPWGFAPFHYGRWLWAGGRWCWAPGPRVLRPVYAPALVAWTGGAPFGMAVGRRPAIGWVPLAPHEPYRPAYRASPGYVGRLNPGRPFWPAPGPGNRGVPGAVTVLPAPRLVPRMPVAPNVWQSHDPALQQQLRHGRFDEEPPARPPHAVRGAPRAAMPLGGSPPVALPVRPTVRPVMPTVPTMPTVPAAPTTPPDARPIGPPPMRAVPGPAAMPGPPSMPPRHASPSTPSLPSPAVEPAAPHAGAGPWHGPPRGSPFPRGAHPPAPSVPPNLPTEGPARPGAATGPFGGPARHPPGNAATDPHPGDAGPGQRRRTPESRSPGRER